MEGPSDNGWPEVAIVGDALGDGANSVAIGDLCRDLVRQLVGEELPVVHRMVVTDSDRYGETIRLESGRDSVQTHTEREEYTGVAITLPNAPVEGKVQNTVIVRAGVMGAALGREDIEPLMPAWLGRYILLHEFGHCVDHALRRRPKPVGLTDAGEFAIGRVATYYRHVTMDELAACLLAGAAVNEEELQWLFNVDATPLQNEVQRMLTRRCNYMFRVDSDLHGLAFDAAQCCWLIVVQYAKALGHMTAAGRGSASIAFPAALANRPAAMEHLHRLARLVGDWAGEYPNWPEDGWPELDEIWDGLARALGCRFEQTAEGSALWIDPMTLEP